MPKLNICAARRPGLTHEQYSRYLRDNHARLVLGTEPVARHLLAYVQQHVYDGCYGASAPRWRYDSVSHIVAATVANHQAATATREYREIIAPDEVRFADQDSPLALMLQESTLPLPVRGPSSLRLLHYLRPRDGVLPGRVHAAWATEHESLLARQPALFAGVRRATLGRTMAPPGEAEPPYAGLCELGFLQRSDEAAMAEYVRCIEDRLDPLIHRDAAFHLLAEAVPVRGTLDWRPAPRPDFLEKRSLEHTMSDRSPSSSLTAGAQSDPWKGRVAFVSGAASGIGLGLARVLASRGARLALSDVRREPLEAACARLSTEGAEAVPYVLDVADRAAFNATAEAVEQRFGKVHYVFNNAGVGELGTPLEHLPDRVFDWVVDVNLRGVFNGIKAFLPRLRRHGEPAHMVNVSSMAALVPDPGWHQGIYCATKLGVMALTVDLRRSLAGSAVKSSVLFPGLVRSDLGATTAALRPVAHAHVPEVPAALAAADMAPEVAGEIVLQAMRRGDFMILTHPQLWPVVAQFQEEVRTAFAAPLPLA